MIDYETDIRRPFYEQGLPDWAIAEKTNYSEKAVRYWRKVLGLKSNCVKRKKVIDIQNCNMLRMYREFNCLNQIDMTRKYKLKCNSYRGYEAGDRTIRKDIVNDVLEFFKNEEMNGSADCVPDECFGLYEQGYGDVRIALIARVKPIDVYLWRKKNSLPYIRYQKFESEELTKRFVRWFECSNKSQGMVGFMFGVHQTSISAYVSGKNPVPNKIMKFVAEWEVENGIY